MKKIRTEAENKKAYQNTVSHNKKWRGKLTALYTTHIRHSFGRINHKIFRYKNLNKYQDYTA